jgi:hypothetical protein
MILWIEAHESPLIVLLMFGLCYGLAALVFVVAVIVSRSRMAADFKATTPTMLTPLGVVASLLVVFLASRVWSNLDHADADVATESSAIREVVLLADTFPGDLRGTVRKSIRQYLQFLEEEEWPAMAEGGASLRQTPPGISDAMAAVLAFVPTEPGQRIAQERVVGAIEQALFARSQRILLSQALVAPIEWGAIAVITALLLMTIAMVHIDRRATMAVNLFINGDGSGRMPCGAGR